MNLIIDWETSGKAYFTLPLDHVSQPRPVQLGAILFDEQRRVRAELNMIVKPDGWVIPNEAAELHGITQEVAMQYGVPLAKVMEAFDEMLVRSTTVIAFNFEFDAFITKIARFVTTSMWQQSSRQKLCLMLEMCAVMKMPKPGGYWRKDDPYKWPKLSEAYRHCFGRDFPNAHDAMGDVRATAEIFFWWQDMKAKNNEPTIIQPELANAPAAS